MNISPKLIDVTPRAASLVKSMCSIGYSFNDAVADIIDNSITAGASYISVFALWKDGLPYVSIQDDGCGMSAEELIEAMRPGSKSPNEARDLNDLGRFGLGLKTASFSQTSLLTVTTWNASSQCSATWDLDLVQKNNAWSLLFNDKVDLPSESTSSSGTLVEWKKLGTLGKQEDSIVEQHFHFIVSELDSHIGRIYHRFIEGQHVRKIVFTINGLTCKAANPFFPDKSRQGPIEMIEDNNISYMVSPYTLPHSSKCSQQEWDDNQGTNGYLESQGFYVYRNHRLIVAGTWFGIAKKKESAKLCRVSIDITSESDFQWNIDIKKSSASPPPFVRKRLRQIIDSLTTNSRRAQLYRSRDLSTEQVIPIWQRRTIDGSIQYILNIKHPLLAKLSKSLDAIQLIELEKTLQIIINTIPIQAIYRDCNDDQSAICQPEVPLNDLIEAVKRMRLYLEESGYPKEEIIKLLRANELFRLRWVEIESSI